MPDKDPSLILTLHPHIGEIDEGIWGTCSGHDNPFVSHAFLKCLEESRSTGPETGWVPRHAAFRRDNGKLEAVVPLYIKYHSYGEYVFDQGWADAFERIGGSYYPKLQAAVPFSPVPGPRILRPHDSELKTELIGNALINLCRQSHLSSFHITFCTNKEWHELGEAGWLQRLGIQFHWQNKGYKSFDDFLQELSSSHRKTIRRERRVVRENGLIFHKLCGSEIKARHWDAFYSFYLATIERKWGSAYLTRDFFTLLTECLKDKVVLMTAEHDGILVAGALNIEGRRTLYGRNWGCIGEWPFLHFELCYYQAIDHAIEKGLQSVEAGAQGPHKIQRGYLPELTYSAHWIEHRGLSDAVRHFLEEERKTILSEKEALAQFSPFRKEGT